MPQGHFKKADFKSGSVVCRVLALKTYFILYVASQGNGTHKETSEVLDEMKIPVLSTAENGAITFTVENGKYSIFAFKK